MIFLEQTKRFMDSVFFPTIKKMGVSHIINMGDTFDRRKFINYNTLNSAYGCFFNPISEMGIPHDIIIGNHDTYYRSTSELNCYDQLKIDPKIHRIHRTPHFETIGGVNFMFLPWINTDNNAESMDAINNTPDNSIICAHLELAGFETQRGSIMEHGMSPDMFHRFDAVFSGHYHHMSRKDNIHYLGSPMQFTWADCDDRRGFHIFDTETRELTFIENPDKMFQKILYDDSAEKPELPDSDFSGKYVKIIIRNKNDHYAYDRFREELDRRGVHNLSTYDEKIMLPLADDVEVDSAQSTGEILQSYVASLVDIDDVTKKELSSLVSGIYKEALEMEI